MKTQRRHELKTNELAERIEHMAQRVKPYSSGITLGLVVVLAVVVVGWLISSRAEQRAQEAWDAYFHVAERGMLGEQTVEEQQEKLRQVAKTHAGTKVEDWARLAAADEGMRRGSMLLTMDKSQARKYLNAAAADYAALKEDARMKIVRQQATFNLGLTYEMLSQLERAQQEYEQVEGPLAAVARQRAKELKNNEGVRQFYDWFAKAEPAMPDLPGLPGLTPGFDVEDPLGGEAASRPRPSPGLEFPGSPLKLPANIEDDLPSVEDDLPPLFGPTQKPEGPAESPSDDASQAPAASDAEAPAAQPGPSEETDAPSQPPAAESADDAAGSLPSERAAEKQAD